MSARIPRFLRHTNGQAYCKYKGRYYYFGKYGLPEAEERYRKFLDRLASGDPQPVVPEATGDMTIIELVVRYLEFAKSYYSRDGRPAPEYENMVLALRPLEALYGEAIGRDFGPAMLVKVQQHLVDRRYARKLINARIGRIKRFFKWCCREQLVPMTLYHGLQCVDGLRKGRCGAKETHPVGAVHPAWVEATLPFLAPQIAAMVQVQRLCGMRPGEVCAMRTGDIAIAGDIWLYQPSRHKNDWREITEVKAVPRAAQAILRPLLKADLQAYIFSPRDAMNWRNAQRRAARKTPMTPSQAKRTRRAHSRWTPGECYDTAAYRRAISYGIKKGKAAGVEIAHWHPNQLRHSIGTEVSRLLGREAAQRWLGHANLKTTEVYVDKEVAELIEIARQLDAHWGAA